MEKDVLVKLICESESKIDELKSIPYDGLKESVTELESVLKEFKEGGETLLSSNDTLQIGIVGQVKAGKSSFLNSLFFEGEDVLPKASTPMTAGLTVMEYGEKNVFEIEYFNEKDWEVFVNQDEEYQKREQEVREKNPRAPESIIKKEIENRTSEKVRSAHEMVTSCSSKAKQKIGQPNDVKEFYDISDLQNVLEQFVGANGEYTSVVKSLYIKMKDERLKGLRIVDTPGVNDPVVSRENRTRTFLHACHGVFLLSASTDFMGSGDVSFLNSRIGGAGIGSVVILASKFDSVLQDLGAEKEMKHEPIADLVDVVETQTKKFKRRLRDISDTIDESLRGRIKVDTTSGIGYSISHKPSNRWDDLEQQIVHQMKRYYPDYFSTEDDVRESFDGLANIPDIREKYLKGVFVDNKEAIISERVEEFFAKNGNEVSSTVERILSGFINRQKQLEETTIEEIQKQKKLQEELFGQLKSKFADVFNSFARNMQNEIKAISNKVRFREIREIPTEDTSESISYMGLLWHVTKEMRIKHVDTYKLCKNSSDSIVEYAEAWNSEWRSLFEESRKNLSTKLLEAITKFEGQNLMASFNDAYYRNIIDSVLDKLRDYKELPIGGVIKDYQRKGDDIANKQFYPSGTSELKESEVIPYLNRKLREHNSELISQYRVLTDSLIEDVKKEVSKNLNGATDIIDQMKSSFVEKLKQEGDEYLSGLEKDMARQTDTLEKLGEIAATLGQLYKLYK